MSLLIERKILSNTIILIIFSVFSECYGNELSKVDSINQTSLHVWDRYVRRFRRDHNFSVSTGYASSKWNIERFGDLVDKSYWTDQASATSEYTFHILISGKTGYLLGTSFGYTYVRSTRLENEFQPSTSWLLPGVRAGISYNYDASGRIFAGVGAQLERFNDLRSRKNSGEWATMSITGESLQMFTGIDVFFNLSTAVHLAWVDTTTYFPRPESSEDFIVNARLSRKTQGGEVGLTYHFL